MLLVRHDGGLKGYARNSVDWGEQLTVEDATTFACEVRGDLDCVRGFWAVGRTRQGGYPACKKSGGVI
jgi:hypothetical protein